KVPARRKKRASRARRSGTLKTLSRTSLGATTCHGFPCSSCTAMAPCATWSCNSRGHVTRRPWSSRKSSNLPRPRRASAGRPDSRSSRVKLIRFVEHSPTSRGESGLLSRSLHLTNHAHKHTNRFVVSQDTTDKGKDPPTDNAQGWCRQRR